VSAIVSPQPPLDYEEELLKLDELFEPLEPVEAAAAHPPPDMLPAALELLADEAPPDPPAPDAPAVSGADEDAPVSET
jgi:hypothetical protein